MKFLVLLFTCLLLFSISLSSMHKNKKKRTMSKTKYLNRFKWPIQATSTPANDWGNQATIYLDRHAPDCGIGAICQFHLRRPMWNSLRYDTQCIMPANCDNNCRSKIQNLDYRYCSWHNTPKNDLGNWAGKSTNYLDRHHVRCPNNKVLVKFQLKSDWGVRKVWYNFKCCPAEVRNCASHRTSLQSYGNMGNIYLDRQVVKVPNCQNQAMTGFRLLSIYNRQSFQYHVDYCDVTGR